MPSNTLSGPGVSPANTKAQLLHIGTGTLGAGAVVRLGDGTATPLTVSGTGLSVAGALAATTLAISGASALASLTLGGIPQCPTAWRYLPTAVLATDTTPVPLTALDFTPVAGAIYALEMMLMVNSAVQASAAQLVNTGGAGTLFLAEPITTYGILAIGGSYAPPTSATAGGTWALVLKGSFTAASAAALTFALRSETTDDITALPGSYLKLTRLA